MDMDGPETRVPNCGEEVSEVFIVIYNRMGVDWSRPTDFTGVIRWLESASLLGTNAITAFWARPLDLRLVAQVRASDAKLHSLVGIHAWDRCLTGYPAAKDARTHIHVLRRNLWTQLYEEGFRKFEVDRQGMQGMMECLARDPYPPPAKGEPPEYFEMGDLGMLGEPSEDVL